MTEQDKTTERIDLKSRVIICIGPEAGGKTEQGKKLAENSDLPYISTRKLLEELAHNDPGEWGEACRKMFAANVYLDGELMTAILKKRFSEEDAKRGFILDGGLRTLPETKEFSNTLKNCEVYFPVTVIKLNISEQTTYNRLLYGQNARKRKDDTPEGIATRLSKYYYQLPERLEIIKNTPNWNLVEIDAEAGFEEVYKNIINCLG